MLELNYNKCGDEVAKCAANYFYWRAHYAYSVDVPTRDKPGGIKRFPTWDYLKQLGCILQTKDKVLIVKERQLFISWEISAWCLWNAQFKYGSQIPYFSKSGIEATELLNKSSRIYHNQPDWLQLELENDNTQEISFKTRESSLRAFTGSKYGGTSFTNSIVVNDEWDYHEYAMENWQAIEPTINEAGRQFIGISTVDKLKATSVFQMQSQQALTGDSPFTLIFFGRGSRPDRNETWYKAREKSVTSQEMEGLTRELFMAQNYPQSIEQALSPANSISVIKSDIIEYLKSNSMPPIRKTGVINIYQDYRIGHKYLCINDPSAGIGKDYHACGIMDVTDNRIVADIYENNIGDKEMFILSEQLREMYQYPLWVIESGTEWSGVLLNMAKESGTRNLFWEDKEHGKAGFRTHEGNRITMWAECASAVNDGLLYTPNINGINEMQTLVYNPQKRGRIDAKKGAHDDYFSMMSLGWNVRSKTVHSCEVKVFNYISIK